MDDARFPSVSVVVPTHRRPEKLSRLLETLGRQSYEGLAEIIVVATEGDEGYRVVEACSARDQTPVRCVTVPNDPSNGRSPSLKRNYGVELASSEWIAFTDDDCEASPGWIEAAASLFHDVEIAAVEGKTVIPSPPTPTVTSRGLTALSLPDTYQTCNMFYRRSAFVELGGFDTAFPFYLEDTDLAWSVLDRGWKIGHAPEAVIEHPVVRAQPWRLLADARRVILMPYLYRKHPARYRATRRRAVRPSHWIYLVAYGATVLLFLSGAWFFAAAMVPGILLLVVLHAIKLFWGCSFEWRELLVTTLLLPIVPPVRFVQMVRGNIRNRVWLWT